MCGADYEAEEILLQALRRQNVAQALGAHTFTASGAALKDNIVHTASGHQAGSFCPTLAFYVAKI